MKSKKSRKILIVGAGLAGLTASVYLSQVGYNVHLLEKNQQCGGLINTISHDGFFFDTGARSIENSGIVRPMLKQLGINLDLLESPVSIGIKNEIIDFKTIENLSSYQNMLNRLYPDSIEEIKKIFTVIEKVLKDMGILYGIDNPFFRDLKNDKKFIFKELLPWVGKFFFALRRMNRMQTPVEEYLKKFSSNQSLIDIIIQHFFKDTPTVFALGYFHTYIDYLYPKGGTGAIPDNLKHKILEFGGQIKTGIEIVEVVPSAKYIVDNNKNRYNYDYLIWCADLKTLYRILNLDNLNQKQIQKIIFQKNLFQSKRGGDSIFTLMLGIDEPPQTFKKISNGHFFYTPSHKGLGDLHRSRLQDLIQNFQQFSKNQILEWLTTYCELNTYEISIPALRDPSLAPPGQTGIIINFFFEYDLIKKVQEAGWYDDFKKEIEKRMIETLDRSIYPNLKDKIVFQLSSTPLTIAKHAGTSEGGITGWSLGGTVPVINNLRKIGKAIHTPISNILQAGQWVYSPAGIPTAILTGWFAAQFIIKKK